MLLELDFDNMTLVDYYKHKLVDLQRQSNRQAEIRQIELAILNFNGFTTEVVQPEKLREIKLIDNANSRPILNSDKKAKVIIDRILKLNPLVN